MFASVFILAFVIGIIVASWKDKKDVVVTEPNDEWSFEPVDGPGWFKFTGEVVRD